MRSLMSRVEFGVPGNRVILEKQKGKEPEISPEEAEEVV